MKSYTTTDDLLAALDGLGLPEGSWIATDADGTLWSADVAEMAWDRLIAERRMLPEAAEAMGRTVEAAGESSTGDVYQDAKLLYRLFVEGRIDDDPIIAAMTFCFAGWTEADARAFSAETYHGQLHVRTYETSRSLLEGLTARGYRLVVVTGSPRLVVEEAVRGMGIDPLPPVLGMDLAVEGGVLTSRLAGTMTWGAGKVTALSELTGGSALQVAFGDTTGDLELLRAARALRVLVHPRPGLRRAGATAGDGWCLFEPPRTVGGDRATAPDTDTVFP